jgi:hypothetical protein
MVLLSLSPSASPVVVPGSGVLKKEVKPTLFTLWAILSLSGCFSTLFRHRFGNQTQTTSSIQFQRFPKNVTLNAQQ